MNNNIKTKYEEINKKVQPQKKTTKSCFFCHVEYCLHTAVSIFTFRHGSSNLGSRSSRVVCHSAVCCPHTDRSVVEKRKKKEAYSVYFLADLLQQLPVNQLELHTDGHLSDELVAALLRHLLAAAQVNAADASTALEIGQRLVGDPVAD